MTVNGMPKSFAARAAAGALGGTIGVLVRHGSLAASTRLPVKIRPTKPRRDPDVFLISKLASALHRRLPGKTRDALAVGLRVGYGAAAGTAIALATRRHGLRTVGKALALGAALGTAAWAVGYAGWMPRARLVPPLRRQGPLHAAVSALGFAAAGVLAALPVLLVDRITAKEKS